MPYHQPMEAMKALGDLDRRYKWGNKWFEESSPILTLFQKLYSLQSPTQKMSQQWITIHSQTKPNTIGIESYDNQDRPLIKLQYPRGIPQGILHNTHNYTSHKRSPTLFCNCSEWHYKEKVAKTCRKKVIMNSADPLKIWRQFSSNSHAVKI